MEITLHVHPTYQLVFRSMHREGHAFAFPCDGRGLVSLDALSERARTNYLYVRATVGREFLTPELCPSV